MTVYLVECENLQDFLQINFPRLGQKSVLCKNKYMPQKADDNQIDISIYFNEKDKYLVSEKDQVAVMTKEFENYPKEIKKQEIHARVRTLEDYHKTLNDLVKESAMKDYDKFRNFIIIQKKAIILGDGADNLEFLKHRVGNCLEDLKDSREQYYELKSNLGSHSQKIARLLKQKATKEVI